MIALNKVVHRNNHCWASKRSMSQLAWFGNTVFEIDICW